jgi:hypothetical protein
VRSGVLDHLRVVGLVVQVAAQQVGERVGATVTNAWS